MMNDLPRTTMPVAGATVNAMNGRRIDSSH